ncbi:alpha/beta hydrolase family protein [Corynebacterium suicordis]|uniref:Alpha/beta fold hydrolase n=1 Tax=Corynebacterium suicordis DSM 45110 TaxID=1121369 RepID=A0ABR9ZGI5_9CORY|nr:alpha/beta fold hydrolase [Corynebacterium suicordis]MBF4552516.1 alpha/beta fold hydrolase [Corynebacterium suicordis DSM 45110]MDR6278525.1 putative alpha/beta hydrolase [Corynebacterium suicordis]
MDKLTITTDDGHQLTGQLILPEAEVEDTRAAVVLHPATGVNQHLYAKFAEHLASRGWPTLIYDLRGSGLSEQPGDAKDKDMLMSQWILNDVPAATEWMKQRYPDRKILAVGHSVGAHGMIATQREQQVHAMVMVAAHAGITRLISTLPERLRIGIVFNVVTPLTSRFLGYVPVEKMGIGKSIPVGVMNQWGSWTRKRNYFFDDATLDLKQRFNQATGPLLSLVFTDDLWANRKAVDVLTDQATSADVEKRDIECGKGTENGPVGHMGFYRSKNAQLWPIVSDWLAAQLDK